MKERQSFVDVIFFYLQGNSRNTSASVPHSSSSVSSTVHNGTPRHAVSPKTPGEAVNGMKDSSSEASALTPPPSGAARNSVVNKPERSPVGQGGDGDHALPMSPPNTPLPQEKVAISSSVSAAVGGTDGEVCQKIQALAL